MNIKILTPEKIIFEGEVDSVLLPGINGEFHIMKNHASIVSSLKNGDVKLFTREIPSTYAENFQNNKGIFFTYTIKSGVIEFNNEKGIVLCE